MPRIPNHTKLALDSVRELVRWARWPALLFVRLCCAGDMGGTCHTLTTASSGLRGVSVLRSPEMAGGDLTSPGKLPSAAKQVPAWE